MRKIWTFMLIGLLLISCEPDPGLTGNDELKPLHNEGYVEVEFELPEYQSIPDKNIHRVFLGFAYTVDSLYRREFFRKLNVSDYQSMYKEILPVGEYYYEARITCSCDGDTCLYGGFPGGKYGMKHAFLNFYVIDQGTTVVKPEFVF